MRINCCLNNEYLNFFYVCIFLYIFQTPKSRYKYVSIHGFYSAAYSTKILLSKSTRLYYICLELQKAHNYILKKFYRKPKNPSKKWTKKSTENGNFTIGTIIKRYWKWFCRKVRVVTTTYVQAKFMKFKLQKRPNMMLRIWLHIIFTWIFHFLHEISHKIIIPILLAWVLYEMYSRHPIINPKAVCSKGHVLGSYIRDIAKSGEISKVVRMTFLIWFQNIVVLYISHHLDLINQYLQNK